MNGSLTICALKLDDAEFEQVVRANPEWNFEQTAAGDLVIVPPTGGTSGKKNLSLSGQFSNWVEDNLDRGEGFDSSTLFILPNGAKRSPDASWVQRERWDALTQQQQDSYVPLCPDFVVELRSPTDRLEQLQAKMREYMDNGARLGWLINPQDRQVEIYRQRQQVEILQDPFTLSGEDVLLGFTLNLRRIFA
ncbi:Uma2 family endonuclease [Chroococcidiopsis sp. FACHB-1243]|uniref:Uma2 family endonuclease n=1 Tax=Chroococcidiopsis sp. [FACHB-1243] TaxID=2692781 RepID=UPI001786C6C5|nr:Uma2 family endonuclease [Chroococcidiopsis sp. [FACHB-1243]]MBD2305503.1 Uma2 family endonuclease [Chroococcidiopsis sp. [FACHB-1243]]